MSEPPERDRLADLWRGLAIHVVVLGHWLIVVLWSTPDGIAVERIFAIAPWTQRATWLFQVMPLFFVVGGALTSTSWTRARAAGTPWPAWVQRRARRLLTPLGPILLVWVGILLVADAVGTDARLVEWATLGAFTPLWFLGVYVAVVALVPLTHALHRRWGLRVVIGLAAAVAAIDMISRLAWPTIGLLNSVLVWACIQQVGYFAPERAPAWTPWALVVGGLAASATLVSAFGYPTSMVPVGGGIPSNASPPTFALLALGMAQIGAMRLLAPPLRRALARERAWRVVKWMGHRMLTVYLWHMSAFVLVAFAVVTTGIGLTATILDSKWWMLRLPWILACGAVLILLVFTMGRFEPPRKNAPPASAARVTLGVGAALTALALLVHHGLHDAAAPGGVAWTVPALHVIAAVALGAWPKGA